MTTQQWVEILQDLAAKNDLSEIQARWAMQEILSGATDSETIKLFLLALRDKGESASEVETFVSVMYENANLIPMVDRCVDVVGTGGDGFNTINISTASAIITTAAGARTLKHGNRAASSKSGAADLLEAFGVNINLDAAGVAECVRQIGIGFAFAPVFHPAMRNAAQARKELGVPTVFNILGPLANPAQPKAVAIGVARADLIKVVAEVLARRGVQGFVFRGDDGLDELSVSTTSSVFIINEGEVRFEKFDPRELGIEKIALSELAGGSASENVEITKRVFAGEKNAYREAVLLNAAGAIAAFKGDLKLGIEQQIANGYVLAKQAVDSGAANHLIERWAELSNELAKSSL